MIIQLEWYITMEGKIFHYFQQGHISEKLLC
jgi:hypothetical protein